MGQLAAALVIDAAMGRHSAQPEFQVLLRLKRGQSAMELEENILSQLLGGRTVCQKMPGNTEDHGLVAAHEIGKVGPGNVWSSVCEGVHWHGQGL